MNDDDQMSPRTAGWIALGVVVLASLATVLAWQGGDAKALKKGLLVAVPLTLVAAVPGLVGRSSWPGALRWRSWQHCSRWPQYCSRPSPSQPIDAAATALHVLARQP